MQNLSKLKNSKLVIKNNEVIKFEKIIQCSYCDKCSISYNKCNITIKKCVNCNMKVCEYCKRKLYWKKKYNYLLKKYKTEIDLYT
jgi:hypothetical protein